MNPEMPDDVEIGYSSFADRRRDPQVHFAALLRGPPDWPPRHSRPACRASIHRVGFDCRRFRLRISPAEILRAEHHAVAMDCAVRMSAMKQFECRPVQRYRGPVPFAVRCCGSATSRKNQSPHHVFAQELGKLPVRNSLSACVVHCARKTAQCPIGNKRARC
jgi:hypothetical protein